MTDEQYKNLQEAIEMINLVERQLVKISSYTGEDTTVYERCLATVLQATLVDARENLVKIEDLDNDQ